MFKGTAIDKILFIEASMGFPKFDKPWTEKKKTGFFFRLE